MLGRLASSPARAAAAPPRLLLIARPAASPASRGSLASSSRRLSAAQIVSTRAFSASAARQGILKRGEDGSPPLWRRHPYVFACGATPVVLALSLGVITLALLGYDASTYRERDVKNVPVSPLALKPERGGPKNLKVASMLIDDHEEGKDATKQKLVIVGGGWGAVGILKHLDPDAWHVTVVAPDNYFLFQPLLPSATVGTVELRSLVEPLRKIVARTRGHFLQAKAIDVDMAERLVEVSDPQGGENFYVPYDKLVVACGSVNSSHGVPGVAEHCFQLKTVPDAQAIRRAIMNNLEEAALPTVSEEERKRLLTFVVSGGGPTGVEFASELYDMVNEDVMEYLPKVLRQEVDVKIIQSRDHILNTYSEQISQFAEKRFKRNEIDMILNARVKEVTPETVVYTQRDPATGNVTEHTIPSGFTLWSTGIGMNPFTVQVARRLPNQYHKRALEVDSHLRVLGAPLGTVYALGDCATIETRLMDHFFELVQKCDKDQNGLISADEFQHMIKIIHRKFPTTRGHLTKIMDMYEEHKNADGVMSLNALADVFIKLSSKMTSLPATAQVADQQGQYLGKKLNKVADMAETARLNDLGDDPDDVAYDPFEYRHLGSLAYLGNSAVFDFNGYSLYGGLISMYLWRSVYWSEQFSFRNRALLMVDWVKRSIWGRDLSKF